MLYRIGLLLCLLILAGCHLFGDQDDIPSRPAITLPAPVQQEIASPTTPILPTATREGFPPDTYDALASTMGICFEAAWDAANRIFIFRTAEEHIQFYNLADNSGLCRNLVRREPFDFSTGDVLVGTWNQGTGCTAQHEILSYQRDDANLTITIQAIFTTSGDCPYELVRGLWLGVRDAQAHNIVLEVQQP